jgi:hypothetical protein
MDSVEKEIYLVQAKSAINKELDRILKYAPEMQESFSEISNLVDQGDLIKASNELRKLDIDEEKNKELSVDVRFLSSEIRVMYHAALSK